MKEKLLVGGIYNLSYPENATCILIEKNEEVTIFYNLERIKAKEYLISRNMIIEDLDAIIKNDKIDFLGYFHIFNQVLDISNTIHGYLGKIPQSQLKELRKLAGAKYAWMI